MAALGNEHVRNTIPLVARMDRDVVTVTMRVVPPDLKSSLQHPRNKILSLDVTWTCRRPYQKFEIGFRILFSWVLDLVSSLAFLLPGLAAHVRTDYNDRARQRLYPENCLEAEINVLLKHRK